MSAPAISSNASGKRSAPEDNGLPINASGLNMCTPNDVSCRNRDRTVRLGTPNRPGADASDDMCSSPRTPCGHHGSSGTYEPSVHVLAPEETLLGQQVLDPLFDSKPRSLGSPQHVGPVFNDS
jgi:hypothetical protein